VCRLIARPPGDLAIERCRRPGFGWLLTLKYTGLQRYLVHELPNRSPGA
jgi:hypothetical protein